MPIKAEPKLTKAQQLARLHAELGKCVEMVAPEKRNAEPHQCTRWAAPPLIKGRGYCAQHATVAANREYEERLVNEKRAALELALDDYIDWVKDHPSVWDSRR